MTFKQYTTPTCGFAKVSVRLPPSVKALFSAALKSTAMVAASVSVLNVDVDSRPIRKRGMEVVP